jgi:Glycosyltransferase family 87
MIKLTPGAVSSTLRALTILALAYSAAHFLASGIRQPFDHPNLAKFGEQTWPLQIHLETGEPVHSTNPEQYGPVFFFVMHPLLRAGPDEVTLAHWLYAIQLVCIASAFVLTCATFKRFLPIPEDGTWTFIVLWLVVIWLNFSPLYTILAQKSVETWELALVSLALYAHLRGWPWVTAVAISAAGLIKVLPLVFLYYLLVTDRRTFLYTSAAIVALLAAGHLAYGPEMGLRYLPRVVAGAAGSSYGLTWHENISLKATLAKMFGQLPSGYLVVLTGWRRTAVTVLGDAAVAVGFAALTWTWLRAATARSRQRTLWEWSTLAVIILIFSPNTTFEYITIALGAVSYAFVRIVLNEDHERRPFATRLSFLLSLFLIGGLVPRQWLNRLAMIDRMRPWTGTMHLSASEAYQYYGFPLVGLVLLTFTLWRLKPDGARTG